MDFITGEQGQKPADDPCVSGLTIANPDSPGTISSPGYSEGQDYDKNSDCTWTITVESGNVQLEFSDAFDMEDG